MLNRISEINATSFPGSSLRREEPENEVEILNDGHDDNMPKPKSGMKGTKKPRPEMAFPL
jgi:hypothetical protein